jgi:hypothetical protein
MNTKYVSLKYLRKLFPCIFLLAVLPIKASVTVDGLLYNVTSAGTARLVGTSATINGNLEVPQSIVIGSNTYKVNSIGARAFLDGTLISDVTLPNTIDSIGENAFSGCNRITALTFPTDLKFIGDFAFMRCTSLLSADLSATSLKAIGNGLFKDCTRLSALQLPVTISYIGNNAFSGCSALESLDFSKMPIAVIGKMAFMSCTHLTSINLPASVSLIEEGAFSGCLLLDNFVFPSGLHELQKYAFENCKSLKEVDLPEGMTKLEMMAFYGCAALETLKIPASLTSIDDYVADGCTALKNIEVASGNRSFKSMDGVLFSITGSTLKAYPAAKSTQDIVTIAPNVTILSPGAFLGCTLPETFNFPDQVTSISRETFSYCSGPTSFVTTSSSSLYSIGYKAFKNVIDLQNITLPGKFSSLGKGAFMGCDSVKNVTVYVTRPPAGYEDCFASTTYAKATLNIPTGTKATYQNASPWKEFLNIAESTNTGILSVTTAKKLGTCYDLRGIRIVQQQPGVIYIHNGRKVLKR